MIICGSGAFEYYSIFQKFFKKVIPHPFILKRICFNIQ
ncbi:hypothetical protein M115_3055 [Bacteroides fragilis str. 3719 T6]|nr:hypothetical protein M101_4683 [Bacteroides fragilis str. 1007-1-F \